MNSLERLSKQYDLLVQPHIAHQPPPIPRAARRPPTSSYEYTPFLQVLYIIWTWISSHLAVFVFFKKYISGADLDLDDVDSQEEGKQNVGDESDLVGVDPQHSIRVATEETLVDEEISASAKGKSPQRAATSTTSPPPSPHFEKPPQPLIISDTVF